MVVNPSPRQAATESLEWTKNSTSGSITFCRIVINKGNKLFHHSSGLPLEAKLKDLLKQFRRILQTFVSFPLFVNIREISEKKSLKRTGKVVINKENLQKYFNKFLRTCQSSLAKTLVSFPLFHLTQTKKGENPRKIILTATAKRRKKVDVAKNPVAPLMKGLEKANSKNKERVFQFPGAGDALGGWVYGFAYGGIEWRW